MSQDVRQSNLFAAEDWTKVYKSFKDVNFQAYDFDSLKQALINYIQIHYPEDFNDYIESSEFIAIVELLAYLGTSLAFRMDLNSRENFMDTAERRDSIIRLARMINYQPKRNIAANGLFKLTGIQTTEPVTDSQDRDLNNQTVFWNDPNNADSYDNFITILNAALNTTNQFGRPYKSGTIGNIPTDLYQINNVKRVEIAYPISINVNNTTLPFEVINSDFTDGATFTERAPDPNDSFHIIYRNDGQGLDSENTGFFVQFRQGTLSYKDYSFDFPIQNRVIDIDQNNINETDVWVQEINDVGDVQSQWTKVPSVSGGTNVIYNSIALSVRDIFEVVSRVDDQVSIKFSDGNFGTVPTGLFRMWYRISANTTFTLRPEEATGLEITIPYIGADSQQYDLRLVFSLEQTISNSSPTETNEEIKNRAPQVYYTQDRMVNSQDYNVFPLTQGSSIAKIHAINRTHAGHSRYIDINDPTGFHQNLNVFGEDGALYSVSTAPSTIVSMADKLVNEQTITSTSVQNFISNDELLNFFYNTYLNEYIRYRQEATPDPTNTTVSRPGVPNIFKYTNVTKRYWYSYPTSERNNTGLLSQTVNNVAGYYTYPTDYTQRAEGEFKFLAVGSKLKFTNGTEYVEATVKSITNPVTTGDATTDNEFIATRFNGSLFVFDIEVPTGWWIDEVFPRYKTQFDSIEVSDISSQLTKRNEFGLKYDIDTDPEGSWFVILNVPTTDLVNAQFDLNLTQPARRNDWIVVASYSTDSDTYTLVSRGLQYVFETNGTVEFYYDSDQTDYNIETGTTDKDEIAILGVNTGADIVETWQYQGGGIWVLIDGDIQLKYQNNTIILKYRDSLPKLVQYWQGDTEISEVITLSDISAGVLNAEYALAQTGDIVRIYYENEGQIGRDLIWNTSDTFVETDGYSDPRKLIVIPADTDNDGIPDDSFLFNKLVSANDLVFHEKSTDYDGYEYNRLWKSNWLDLRAQGSDLVFDYNDVVACDTVLIVSTQESIFKTALRSKVVDAVWNDNFNNNSNVDGKILFIERRDTDGISIITQNIDSTGQRIFETIRINNGSNQTVNEIVSITSAKSNADSYNSYITATSSYDVLSYQYDIAHSVNNGKSFTLNSAEAVQDSMYYKWTHYAPADNRIDPSISNIIDMVTLTQSYYDDVQVWKTQNLGISQFPVAPTTEELRIQYGDLDTYKMLSDQIVFQPATFKVLFGDQAKEEYKCTFNVVKVPSTTYTDNEIKSKVISAIDEYFNINNWDFGESFYYTELSAYIHQSLVGIIGSIVIVPTNQSSSFGNLFQIRCEPDELFISTATVANVQIVNNLTDTNMRIN